MYMDNGDGGSSRGYRGGRGRSNQRSYQNNRGGGRQGPAYADSYQQSRGGRNTYSQPQYSGWDNRDNHGGSGQGRSGNYRGRGRTWGRSQGGRGRTWTAPQEPEDIEFLGRVTVGKDPVTSLILDPSASQIYTASKDGTLRTWTCPNPTVARPVWTRASEVALGGVIDTLLLEGGFMFVGMHAKGSIPSQMPGLIMVVHMATNGTQNLEGHQGEVRALAAAGELLFSGGQDASIRVWKFNMATNSFELGVLITEQQGGHNTSVISLVPANQFLFSADMHGTIKVWDMGSGTCTQTLAGVHSSAVTDMLFWENHLLSASLDSTVKVWAITEAPQPGAVLKPEPEYTHTATNDKGEAIQGGILKLAGALDTSQQPVLLTSHNGENAIRLWDLPTFGDRGLLRSADTRALAAGFGHMLFSGDRQGNLKHWRWKAASMPVG